MAVYEDEAAHSITPACFWVSIQLDGGAVATVDIAALVLQAP